MLDSQDVECPYCGEVISMMLDSSAGKQRYIEDCHVCCQPISVDLEVGPGGDAYVRVHSQDEV